jgi:hypothetical protein
MTDGRKTAVIMGSGVIWPPIYSMVVVTSPITDQAPPAFAAITMIAANNSWGTLV